MSALRAAPIVQKRVKVTTEQRRQGALVEQRRRRHAMSARQVFDALRPQMLASRPVLVAGLTAEYPTTKRVAKVNKRTGVKTWSRVPAVQRVERAAVFGRPAFRNVIENGQHL